MEFLNSFFEFIKAMDQLDQVIMVVAIAVCKVQKIITEMDFSIRERREH